MSTPERRLNQLEPPNVTVQLTGQFERRSGLVQRIFCFDRRSQLICR